MTDTSKGRRVPRGRELMEQEATEITEVISLWAQLAPVPMIRRMLTRLRIVFYDGEKRHDIQSRPFSGGMGLRAGVDQPTG